MKRISSKPKRLTRIKKPFFGGNGNLTGVCEGLGEFFHVNPWYIRLGFVGLSFFQPWVAGLGYLALAVFLPGGEYEPSFYEKRFGSSIQIAIPQKEDQEKEISYIICEKCHTAVIEDSRYCHHCGNKLS